MTETSPKLKRTVNLFHATLFGIGLILGAGIYVIIGDAAEIAGNLLWISFIISSFLAICTGFSYAELSSIFPKSAAEYVYVKNSLGISSVSIFVGCLTIFVGIVSASAVAIGFSNYLSVFLPGYPKILFSLWVIAILSFINFYGIRESIWFNTIFTLIELSGLVIIIFIGFMFGNFNSVNFFESPFTNTSQVQTFFNSIGLIFASSAIIFFAYYGFENIPNIAEETKNPSKTISKAILLSIIITTIIYVLVAISSLSLATWQEISSSDVPLSLILEKVFETKGNLIISAIAIFATTNTVLMMLVSSSRIIYGMSKDGALLDFFSKIHKTRNTPWLATIITGLLSTIVIIVSSNNISFVSKIAVFGIFTVFTFVNFSLIFLKLKKTSLLLQQQHQSLYSLNYKRVPIFALVGVIISFIILLQFEFTIIFSSLVIMCILFLIGIYFARSKKSEYKKS
ncbi:MAG TPA: APC family permease [Nitrososphaeraceae archaeon]|nr:APC family permease [Nitrososphaeraceae archaeon]